MNREITEQEQEEIELGKAAIYFLEQLGLEVSLEKKEDRPLDVMGKWQISEARDYKLNATTKLGKTCLDLLKINFSRDI